VPKNWKRLNDRRQNGPVVARFPYRHVGVIPLGEEHLVRSHSLFAQDTRGGIERELTLFVVVDDALGVFVAEPHAQRFLFYRRE
jgi:hypothetical protein